MDCLTATLWGAFFGRAIEPQSKNKGSSGVPGRSKIDAVLILKGSQKVAGGRSAAKTPGRQNSTTQHPEGMPETRGSGIPPGCNVGAFDFPGVFDPRLLSAIPSGSKGRRRWTSPNCRKSQNKNAPQRVAVKRGGEVASGNRISPNRSSLYFQSLQATFYFHQ